MKFLKMHRMLGPLTLGTFLSTMPGQACKHAQFWNMERITIDVVGLLLVLDPRVTYMSYYNLWS